MAQSGYGRIRLFHDFLGAEIPIALTTDQENLGDFFVGGEGIEDNTAGVALGDSDAIGGVGIATSGATDADTTAVMTAVAFDVALMGPLVLEVRIRLADLDAKAVYVGFSDVNTLDLQLTEIIDGATGTTLTLTASDLCGFYFSSELTDDEDWHGVYNGGSTTGATDSSTVDLDDDAVAGEWQVLHLEIDANGTARWYIDGVLLQTVVNAVSTTVDQAVVVAAAANSAEAAVMHLDYIAVEANRDWTV
tara:strand:+ start:3723 stop:4466 length:744 start_codon:yes stop_codon:yes gene_type:complete